MKTRELERRIKNKTSVERNADGSYNWCPACQADWGACSCESTARLEIKRLGNFADRLQKNPARYDKIKNPYCL